LQVIGEARDEVDGAVNKDDVLKMMRAANEDEVIDAATGTTVVRDPHGIYACVRAYLHAYTYIHTCAHACIHTCMHTCIHPHNTYACMHAYIHACMHTYIHASAYIHMRMHTYIQTS